MNIRFPSFRKSSIGLTHGSLVLLIFIHLGLPFGLLAQRNQIKFEHISIEEGLSQSTVSCILQDKKGFIWFGTEDGLNKYDGYSFAVYKNDKSDETSLSDSYILSIYEDESGILWIGTYSGGLNKFDRRKEQFVHYKHDPDISNTLSNNMILCIHEDSTGTLWIGTYDGLNKFDRKKEKFTRYKHDPHDPSSLSHDRINSIYEDKNGTLWVGTEGGGLNRFDPEREEFIHWVHQAGNPDSLSNDFVHSIYEDSTGALWIGTDNGLNRFDREKGTFTSYFHDPKNPYSLSHNTVRSVYEDKTGRLWIGTFGGGLNRFDREKEQFEYWLNEPGSSTSLNSNHVLSIYEDRIGMLWIGTFGGGVNRFNPEKDQFAYLANEPGNPHSLSDNLVLSIFEDKEGMLWIGTGDGGLNRFDREKGEFTHWIHEPGKSNGLCNNRVRAICEDSSGMLWIGTFDGLNRYDRETGQFACFRHDPSNPESLSHNHVRAIYEDRMGDLWIGTFGGLNRFNREKETFISYTHDPDNPHSLSHDRVVSICEDRGGTLWIGTGNGLNRFDREKNQFTHWVNEPGNPYSLSNNRVQSIYEDKNGVLWIGTYGGGLNRFDPKEARFVTYNEKDGLPNDVVYGILEDDEGDLWLSTNKGISRFDPLTETFRNFDVNDGLQSNEFNSGAYHKNKNGEMFFGGINGLNAFYPESIKNNPHIPPVVISDFQIFNKSVPIGERADGRIILDESITETDKIHLSHKDRVFSFEFAALHFISPEKNEYAYMLEGFEKQWNYVGNRRFASYTNLHPGRYIFRVKASNSDGVWNEEGVSLTITITPPFWQTWWFRGIGAVVLLLLLYTAYQVRTRSITERARYLERKIEERTSELRLEVTERKRKEQEAKRRTLHAELIYDIGKRITGKLKLKELLDETVTSVSEAFNYYGVSIFLADEKSHQVNLQSVAGRIVGDSLPGSKLSFGEGMTGGAAATGEAQISNDVRKNPYYVSLGEEITKSELSVPIKKENKLIGVFDIQSDRFDAFDESDVKTMETLSAQIAVAIENARLYEQAQREIRVRKKTEDALRKSEDAMRSLFNGVPVGLYRSAEGGKILDANPALVEMFRFPNLDSLLRINAAKLYTSPDVRKSWQDMISREGVVKNFEVQMRRMDGEIIWVCENARIVSDDKGRKLFYEGSLEDITKRKQAEENLMQTAEKLASSNKELEHFAYVASHDLQEPLRMVASYVQLLEKRYKDKLDDNAHDFIGYAVDGASRMQKMINDLLTYSRIGTRGKPFASIDCEAVLNQVISNLKIAIKESKAVVTHDKLPEVVADETQLVQLFQNLINNSLKFRDKKRPRIHISAERNSREWIFSVRDNGIGIDTQYAERIFQIFQRLHGRKEYPGTGIGLAVCKRIVERHRGRIWVDSKPGKGATFCFTLPVGGKADEQSIKC